MEETSTNNEEVKEQTEEVKESPEEVEEITKTTRETDHKPQTQQKPYNTNPKYNEKT